jgi:hypothetical protein
MVTDVNQGFLEGDPSLTRPRQNCTQAEFTDDLIALVCSALIALISTPPLFFSLPFFPFLRCPLHLFLASLSIRAMILR